MQRAASSFFRCAWTNAIYTLSLHDALPISDHQQKRVVWFFNSSWRLRKLASRRREQIRQRPDRNAQADGALRSEEHTSELQSRRHLVCRLLLEKRSLNR